MPLIPALGGKGRFEGQASLVYRENSRVARLHRETLSQTKPKQPNTIAPDGKPGEISEYLENKQLEYYIHIRT